jgi:hypothetical protein
MSSIDGASAADRKAVPLFTGVFKYFPDALIEVARLSKIGNDQHNPGEPLHWSKHKSFDHGNCILRHQLDAGAIDDDNVRHSTKVAWRALAQLQIEIEAEKAGLTPEAYIAKLIAEAEAEHVTVAEGPSLGHLITRYQGTERRVGEKDRRKVADLALGRLFARRDLMEGRRSTDTTRWTDLPQVKK